MNMFSPIIRIFVRRVFKGEIDGSKKAIEEDYRKQFSGYPGN